jgi:hemoglobin-like flavoprotein
MSELVTERTRDIIVRSLPIVRQHKDEIAGAMHIYLGRVEEERRTFGKSDIAATILTELLLRQASLIAGTGQVAGLETTALEHAALGIDGRHYSRFGDALVPILRDSLGINLPREVSSAWSDTFWTIIRAAQAKQALTERGADRAAARVEGPRRGRGTSYEAMLGR